jgi:hypothetical protein
MSYMPGEGYDKGFKSRMEGSQLPTQAVGGSSDPYWQEYATGWRDADSKIIKEARQRNECNSEYCKDKQFLQD